MVDTFTIDNTSLSFETTPGVFSQYGLDQGSKLLLKTLEFPLRGTILDLGCGCGILGIISAALSPKATAYLIDSDIRAVRLSKLNAINNDITNIKVLLSDITSDIPPQVNFDTVISNPPTHQGRETLMRFISGTHRVLKTGGQAYFVVNRMTSVLNKLADIFGNSEKLTRQNGYIVFRAIK